VPESVPGADGPTLTAAKVANAWRAAEETSSEGVSTGRLKASVWPRVNPASVITVAGHDWVDVRFKEWKSLGTVVFASPGEAASKLQVIRAMLREPCSYLFLPPDRYLVASLARDRPDDLLVYGTGNLMATTEVYVRVGNTVTLLAMDLGHFEDDEWTLLIKDTLSRS
jgi:hypothetical protein